MIDTEAREVRSEVGPAPGTNRRRSERVRVNLPGRYMLEDGAEHPCECLDISAGGVRLRAAVAGPWGSRVIAYIDGLGRIEGHIVRRAPGWFALEARGGARHGERVQERIAALLEGAKLPRDALARPLVRRDVALESPDGRRRPAQLTDINRDGAALLSEALFEVGERLRLDKRDARVARSFPGGVTLEFEPPAPRRTRA